MARQLKVIRIDKNGNEKVYNNIEEASTDNEYTIDYISRCIYEDRIVGKGEYKFTNENFYNNLKDDKQKNITPKEKNMHWLWSNETLKKEYRRKNGIN